MFWILEQREISISDGRGFVSAHPSQYDQSLTKRGEVDVKPLNSPCGDECGHGGAHSNV